MSRTPRFKKRPKDTSPLDWCEQCAAKGDVGNIIHELMNRYEFSLIQPEEFLIALRRAVRNFDGATSELAEIGFREMLGLRMEMNTRMQLHARAVLQRLDHQVDRLGNERGLRALMDLEWLPKLRQEEKHLADLVAAYARFQHVARLAKRQERSSRSGPRLVSIEPEAAAGEASA